MLGYRHRIATALAALAFLALAGPAFAERRTVRVIGGEGQFRIAQPVAVRTLAVPVMARGSDHDHHGVVGVRYYGYPFGFYAGWDPFWYAGPWWYYGWWQPQLSYALQPAVPQDQVLVTLHIKPSKAEVSVDGRTIGKARNFDSVREPIWLKPGKHLIEIDQPGYQSLRLALELEGGRGYDLSYGLNKGSGLDGRSSEPAAVPAPGSTS